ncbi:MAG: DUF3267 domain-containing protein [Bacillota bacterium]|nr:DUF3267 domain-containing protein [Bacillota bacterium]
MKERILTEKEKIRLEKVMSFIKQKEKDGFVSKNMIISIGFANVMAFVLSIPIILPIGFFFFQHNIYNTLSFTDSIFLFLSMMAGIIIHEAIHGFVWGLFIKDRSKSIEFGIMKDSLTPYCTCLEPLSKGQYILGAIMPGLLLGILPMLISLINGSLFFFFFGSIMLIGAGGDFTIILKLLLYKTNKTKVLYMDHPTECGLIILEK